MNFKVVCIVGKTFDPMTKVLETAYRLGDMPKNMF